VAYQVVDPAEDVLLLDLVDDGESPPEVGGSDADLWAGMHPLERYLATAGGLEESDLDPRALRAEDKDLARLRNQAKQEGRLLRPKLLMVLTEMVLLDLSLGEFDRVVDLLQAYSFEMIAEGRFCAYLAVLQRLGERAQTLPDERAAALQELLAHLSGAGAAERATAALRAGRCDDPSSAASLLEELGPGGVGFLLDAASRGESGEAEPAGEEIIHQALGKIALRNPQLLWATGASPNEAQLRLLANILPDAVPPEQAEYWGERLRILQGHPRPEVRLEMLRLLARVRPAELAECLRRHLNDEDAGVRQTAARLLSRRFETQATQPLLEVLLSPDFEKRPLEEQAAFFESLALASPTDVFPLLEKTISRRDWLAPRHWRVQKACALRALGVVPIEKAGPLLMKYRNARDPLLAEASRKALERQRHNLGPGGSRTSRVA
jgi:hypothetical protein